MSSPWLHSLEPQLLGKRSGYVLITGSTLWRSDVWSTSIILNPMRLRFKSNPRNNIKLRSHTHLSIPWFLYSIQTSPIISVSISSYEQPHQNEIIRWFPHESSVGPFILTRSRMPCQGLKATNNCWDFADVHKGSKLDSSSAVVHYLRVVNLSSCRQPHFGCNF